MSHQMYNELWREAQTILEEASYTDNLLILSRPSKDKRNFHKQLSVLYAKYILAINKLGECYDQMVHPQKRLLVRKVLDCSVIR